MNRDDRYRLQRDEFDVTGDRPVVGVTHVNGTESDAALLPESRLHPN